MVDGVINLKMNGNKRLMQISKMNGASYSRDWFEMKISKAGLSVVGKAK
jgi:hypothetical protein